MGKIETVEAERKVEIQRENPQRISVTMHQGGNPRPSDYTSLEGLKRRCDGFIGDQNPLNREHGLALMVLNVGQNIAPKNQFGKENRNNPIVERSCDMLHNKLVDKSQKT